METLLDLDRDLFLWLNSLHTDILDPVMYWVTYKYTWLPLYLILVLLIVKKYQARSVIVLLTCALLILLVDQSVSALIKPLFERPRPCNEQMLANQLHLVTPCGSGYSFVSAHAANTFAIATLLFLYFKGPMIWLLIWAALVAYSRVYVGVHYPLDIMAGALYGTIIALGLYRTTRMLPQRMFKLL